MHRMSTQLNASRGEVRSIVRMGDGSHNKRQRRSVVTAMGPFHDFDIDHLPCWEVECVSYELEAGLQVDVACL